MEQSVLTSSNTFWGTPFLEKGPPKITEGGPCDPHWPISRINPVFVIFGIIRVEEKPRFVDFATNLLAYNSVLMPGCAYFQN